MVISAYWGNDFDVDTKAALLCFAILMNLKSKESAIGINL